MQGLSPRCWLIVSCIWFDTIVSLVIIFSQVVLFVFLFYAKAGSNSQSVTFTTSASKAAEILHIVAIVRL